MQRRNVLLLLAAALLLLGIHHYAGVSVSPTSSPVAALSVPPKVSVPAAPAAAPVSAPRQTNASQGIESRGPDTSGLTATASRYALAQIELNTGEVVALGQPYELVIKMNPPRNIGRLVFTVSVDPHVLGLRGVRRGDGSSLETSSLVIMQDVPATGQTTIQMDLSNAMPEKWDGSIAIVQFEALAVGAATMVVSDLAMSDLTGTMIPYAAVSLTAQAEVLSGPI